MENSQRQVNAENWANKLIAKPLPTLSRASILVLKAIQQDNLSYLKLSEMINRDPVLAFTVTTSANQRMGENSEGCKTLEHAISMLGIEQLKQITKKIPVVSNTLEDIGHFYYTRIVSSSLLAAQIAQEMAEIKRPELSHNIYWSTLFLGAPLWYLWRFAAPEMRLIRYAIRSNFKLPEVAEQEILGTTIEAISRQIVEKLKPSHLISEALNPNKLPSPREWVSLSQSFDGTGTPKRVYDAHLNLKLNDPSFMITLSNLIAGHAAHDWYSSTVLRYQKIMAVWLGVPIPEAIALTHRCAADMSRQHPFPGIMLPAAKLILPPRPKIKAEASSSEKLAALKKQYDEQTSATEIPNQTLGDVELPKESPLKPDNITVNLSKAPMPKNIRPAKIEIQKEPKTRGNKQIFDELIHIMLHQPENFTDLHELMNAATQGVAFGLGLNRSTVALVNGQKTRLKAYYTVGTRNNPQLGNFEIDLTKPSIFSKLIAKPASIWVKPTSSKKVWAMIPIEFKQICGSTDFFLMSIFVNNKPVAIFYADVKGDKVPLTEEDYVQFKHMCGATAHCLLNMAKKKNS